ncbi:MAG TPA: Ig-like domain-containing protein [Gaiellaceae bacterium]|nr:Ig-like domain-containing protein [Gaiellaceae bacterium]
MPTISFRPASAANYTNAHRPSSAIKLVVIHVTESSAAGAISWFRNPKAQASANYVVAKTGAITETVRDQDIAWHAGNWRINSESIGIEHEGYTYRNGSITDREYRASARLVAYELRHYLLPIDRKHIIGHNQVPDPNHAGLFGGFAHHTDPGPHWKWTRYLSYVRSYARGNAPAPRFVAKPAAGKSAKKPAITGKVNKAGKVQVRSSGFSNGQTVQGFVPWRASVASGGARKVEFLIDGRLRWTETKAPFVFGGDGSAWDTTRETNGPHVLTLRVVTTKGRTAGQSLRVVVANSPYAVAVSKVANGQAVKGRLTWSATPSGAKTDHVDFLVDGTLSHTEKQSPYTFDGWDTTKLANGSHTLSLRAVAVDGRVAESSVTVVVANPVVRPPSRPTATSVSIGGPYDGASLSGVVRWETLVKGPAPDRVEFRVDGRWRWTARAAPYLFDGTGLWDTSRESLGWHVVNVRAVRASDGLILDQSTARVRIVAPAGSGSGGADSRGSTGSTPSAPLTLTSSVADGATVRGTLAWTATADGATPDRVDFYVDGKLRHTERSAPYEFAWDSSSVADGSHTLLAKATQGWQTARASVSVTVANTPPLAIASQTLTDGQALAGAVDWEATTSGPTPERVEFWVDGTRRWTENQAPFVFGGDGATWDTTKESDGAHTLLVKAVAGKQTATATLTVTVANAPAGDDSSTSPPPAPASAPPSFAIASQSLADGQTVDGVVSWTAVVTGDVRRVEFYVGHRRTWTARDEPFAFGGDGNLDTTRLPDGPVTLTVRAVARDRSVLESRITVTVANGG